jgi:inner membrane protein
MDTITHGLVGAIAAQAAFSPKLGRKATLCGFVAGVLPDADGLLRNAADPLFRMEYHRHFTHALLFVPLGGLLAMLPFLLTPWGRRNWKTLYLACTLAYGMHAPLDLVTSYGTLLLWPFTWERVKVDWMPIIDPLCTIPLLLFVIWSCARKNARIAVVGVCVGLFYISLGAMQEWRGLQMQERLAASRGHTVERGRVLPTLGNLVVWRSIYVADGKIHADAFRLWIPGRTSYVPGESVPLLTRPPNDPGMPADLRERLAREFDRFSWFADGYVARSPQDPSVIADMRYTQEPQGVQSLWGIRLVPERQKAPVEWVRTGTWDRRRGLQELWALVGGRSPKLRPWLL